MATEEDPASAPDHTTLELDGDSRARSGVGIRGKGVLQVRFEGVEGGGGRWEEASVDISEEAKARKTEETGNSIFMTDSSPNPLSGTRQGSWRGVHWWAPGG